MWATVRILGLAFWAGSPCHEIVVRAQGQRGRVWRRIQSSVMGILRVFYLLSHVGQLGSRLGEAIHGVAPQREISPARPIFLFFLFQSRMPPAACLPRSFVRPLECSAMNAHAHLPRALEKRVAPTPPRFPLTLKYLDHVLLFVSADTL